MAREMGIEEITAKYDQEYMKKTPKSRAALLEAAKFLPGGDSRIATFFYPHPLFVDMGAGCRFKDIDGNEYIDFHNCYTAMIHGHAYPPIIEATTEAMRKFAPAIGAPTTLITEWAETLCRRIHSVEKIRFCNSGTEAAMMAIRTARAFTGKDKIVKPEGGYNGSYDAVVQPSYAIGIPKSIQTDQLTIPFNNKGAAEKAIRENKDQIACLVIEGMMGNAGMIPPQEGYLEHLRKVTQENDVLMILDEVMTFRLDCGGLQHMCGIKPDLTYFGKTIGGGFPVGAWGGREDLMEQYDPIKGQALIHEDPGLPAMAKIYHGGTFNANPLVATAGKIMIDHMTAKEIARINQLGESLAEGIRRVFAKLNMKAQVTGIGSLQNLHFTPDPVKDFKAARSSQKRLMHLVHMGLIERGVFLPARGLFCVSTPMTGKEIDTAIKAMEDVMTALRPIIEREWPELVS